MPSSAGNYITARLEPLLVALGHDPAIITLAIDEQMAQSPKLASCTPDSISTAIQKTLFLGLNPFPAADEAYIRPRKDRATLVPGYRGLIKLAYANPRVAFLEAHCVYPGDKFAIDLGSDRPIVHAVNPLRRPDEIPIGAYAILWWRDHSRPLVEYMTAAEINANAKRGGATERDSSPWTTDWPQMARKTVIKRLLNYIGHQNIASGISSHPKPSGSKSGDARPSPQAPAEEPAVGKGLYQSIRQQIESASADEISGIIRNLRSYQELDSHEKEELFNLARARKHQLTQA